MIEYVLLLFVTISLLFAAKNVMGAIGEFMDGYMGRYVRCLMDHGELPAMGIDAEELKKNTTGSYVCSKQFTFSAQTGFQLNGSGGSGGGGGSGGSSKGASSSSDTDSNNNGRKSSSDTSASDGESSGSSLSDVASRERRRRSGAINLNGSGSAGNNELLKPNRLRSSDGADEYSENKSQVIAEAPGASAVEDNETARSGRARYRTVPRGIAETIEKNSKKAQTNSKGKTTAPTVLSESIETLGPRKSVVPMYEPKPRAPDEPPDAPFSFTKFFKWIIIIVLVIMIVIFFGGQILNYSKSDN